MKIHWLFYTLFIFIFYYWIWKLYFTEEEHIPPPTKSPNEERGMEKMGGVPLTLWSHAQKVETIRSLKSSETYFICTNISAIGAATEKLGV